MRRSTPPFTVEVRRKWRRVLSETPEAWLVEPKPQITDSAQIPYLTSNDGPRAKLPEEVAHLFVPPRKGRVLPSLIEDKPQNRLLRGGSSSVQETPSTSATPLPLRGRPRPGAIQRSKFSQKLPPPAGVDAIAADKRANVQESDDGAFKPPAAPFRPNGKASAPEVRVKKKPRKVASLAFEQNQGTPLYGERKSAPEADAMATAPSDVLEVPVRTRKRSIMGRYVFGNELKPGERWKRLLRWAR